MIKANYHIHTIYCDGKNTPEEMVLSAIEKGMFALGFSGHSYQLEEDYGMTPEGYRKYREEVLALKEKYADKIDIFLGIEQDSLSLPTEDKYDYVIGAVHGFYKGEHYLSVDHMPEIMENNVHKYYDNDYYTYIEDYYRVLADRVLKCRPDFIAHFDLVAKFNQGNKYFDESGERYQSAALTAMEQLAKAEIPFEINTGAICRGYRDIPYPAPFLLKRLHELGGRIILSGDTHSKENLLYGYEMATEVAKKSGFTTAVVITKEGMKDVLL